MFNTKLKAQLAQLKVENSTRHEAGKYLAASLGKCRQERNKLREELASRDRTIREQHTEMAQLRRQVHALSLNARAGTVAEQAVALIREICARSAKYDAKQRYRIPSLTRNQWDRMHHIIDEVGDPNG